MNPWEILGIPFPSDEGTIRQAYAKLLKTTRPEDGLEKFQALRTAYEVALSICRSLRSRNASASFQAAEEAETAEEDREPLREGSAGPANEIESGPAGQAPEDAGPIAAGSFLNQFSALAKDYDSYPDQARWLALLNKSNDMNYWEREELGRRMADILPEFPYLPSFAWAKLEETFNWEKHRGLYTSTYHDADLGQLKHMGKMARLLRSEEILPLQGGPEYLDALIRFHTHQDAIQRPDVSSRLSGIFFDRDTPPAALRLHLSLLHSIGDWETLSAPEKLFGGSDPTLFIPLLQGEALRRLGKYEEALKVYEDILKRCPIQMDALRWSAACMERLGDTPSAIPRYQAILEISSKDVHASCALARLTAPPSGGHRTWRTGYFAFWDAVSRFLPYAIIAIILLGTISRLLSMLFLFYW